MYATIANSNRVCRLLLMLNSGLHSYACDCVTHHLFHPYGTSCLQNKEDEEMVHQVASDDSLQSILTLSSLTGRLELNRACRSLDPVLQPGHLQSCCPV